MSESGADFLRRAFVARWLERPDPAPIAPRSWAPTDYIREEVWRQGFNLATPHGQKRVAWMTDAWEWAHHESGAFRYPSANDILQIGQRVEPEINACGIRRGGVRVGNRICPPADEVPGLLAALMPRAAELAPLDFYRELLLIHPFSDGNGRTGKVVLAWLAGSWEAPFFPAADFWGAPIRNP